ncbi:MAG: AsmA-like C-terminal region-containing protein [Bacteroidota bacterium]
MKYTKLILKILGITLLVIILLAAVLPFAFRNKIVTAVKNGINEQLTAKVEFADYSLSLFRSFPNFSLGLKKLSVVGSGDFSKDTLVKTDELQLTIDLLSVLKGNNYTITKISLDKPSILLKVLKDGKVNWDITKPVPPGTPPAAEAPSKFRLTVSKFIMKDGKMVYNDLSSGMMTSIAGIDLSMKADITLDIYKMQAELKTTDFDFVYGGMAYMHNINAAVTSDIEADMKNFKFTLSNTDIQMNALNLGLEGWFSMPFDDINMDLKFEAKKSEFRNFLSLVPAVYAKDFDKVETKGSLALSGFAKGVFNDRKMPAFGLKLLIANAMFHYPGMPVSVKNIGVDVNIANANGVPDNTVIDLRKLHMEAGSNTLDAQMNVATPVSDPAIKGGVKARIQLAEVKQFYPLEADAALSGLLNADIRLAGRMSSIDKKQYEAFQASGELNLSGMKYKSKDFKQGLDIRSLKLLFNPAFVDMPVCDLQFGKTDLKASGKLVNAIAYVFNDGKLSGNFESHSNLIDLNEFMSGDTPATTSDTGMALSVIRIPANLDFVAKTTITKLIYDNIIMTNVAGGLRIADEKLTLDGLQMNLLGGSMVMTGSYDSKPVNPAVNFNFDVKRFDIPLTAKTFKSVSTMAPVAKYCSGKTSTKIQISTSLDEKMMPILPTMNGKGMIGVEQLVVKDFIPMNKLSESLKIDKFRKMDIGNAMMEVIINKGRVEVKPFTFMTDKIKSTVSGWNALDQQISYVSVMEIPRAMLGPQANAVFDGLVKKAGSQGVVIKSGETIIVSAKMTGTFTNPLISTDLKNSANAALNEAKQQVEQQVKQKVQEEITKVKEDASVQAQKLIADAEKKAAELKAAAKVSGDQLVAEADKQGKALVSKASDPISKMAAKETAKQLTKQAQQKSDKLQKEADQQGKAIIDAAKVEAGRLK